MALAGSSIVLKGGVSSNPSDEIDGANNIRFGRTREMLETTDFKDTSGARTRLAGLKDGVVEISGDYEPSDTAQTAIESKLDDGNSYYVQVLWDGTNGHEIECKVESFDIDGEVAGKAQFTATLQFTAAASSV